MGEIDHAVHPGGCYIRRLYHRGDIFSDMEKALELICRWIEI